MTWIQIFFSNIDIHRLAFHYNKRMRLNLLRNGLLIILAIIFLPACASLQYYNQAITGHLGVLAKQKPIASYIDSSDTSTELRQQLEKVVTLRTFAAEQLYMPVERQYSSYADLNRRYVVWNVFAAPSLSTQAKSWCYPVIGCADYRGYYDKKNAQAYAQRLANDGFDVYVAGVTAYSTLGWFNDPVLNTFINRSDAELANLIFHEFAHQLLYAKGDTVFNESFATVVAREGVRRWMQQHGNTKAYQRFLQDQSRRQQFVDLVIMFRDKLQTLYDRDISDEHKHKEKARILGALRNRHQLLKASWGGRSDYDQWFEHNINNAQLNTVAAYNELVPAFEALLDHYQGNLGEFYAHCKQLALMDLEKRKQILPPLTQASLYIQAE